MRKLVVAVFLLLGLLRGGGDSVAAAFSNSEFMAVFVTALDVRQIYLTGASLGMNLTLFLADLVRLVPQQILPFEKIDPASWYVTTFYPEQAAEGGGMAFGMLAEAALSGGFVEALVRGMALGTVLSVAFNFLAKGRSIWRYVIYLWLITSIYQCFRDTTFTIGGRFVFQLLPAILLCASLTYLMRNTRDRSVRRVGNGISRQSTR